MIRAAAVLYTETTESRDPWTSKRIAQAIGMNSQSTLLMLGRLRDKGWVEYDKDPFGRRAWIITSNGMAGVAKELRRRVFYEFGKNETVCENILGIVERAIEVMRRLKGNGFGDIQTRETLINYHLERIEWALRVFDRHHTRVTNPGGYINSLIKNGNQQERRCRAYLQHVNHNLPEKIVDMILYEALRTMKPFRTTVLLMRTLDKRKDYWAITHDDIGEILYPLYLNKTIKSNGKYFKSRSFKDAS